MTTIIKTVADLKQEISIYQSETGRIPGAVELQKSGVEILYQITNMKCDLELSVYNNGLVLYRCGKNKTVFRLHKVPDTCCEQQDPVSWEFSLILYGEDKLCLNQDVKEHRLATSFCDLGDGSYEIEQADPVNRDPLKEILEKEVIELICSLITEKQEQVFRLIYKENITQQEVARRLGMSRTAVANAMSRVYETIRKHKSDIF